MELPHFQRVTHASPRFHGFWRIEAQVANGRLSKWDTRKYRAPILIAPAHLPGIGISLYKCVSCSNILFLSEALGHY